MCTRLLWSLLRVFIIFSYTVRADECSIRESYGRAWLETDRPLSLGVARAIIARVCLQKAAILQLWVPIGKYSYKLVWQKEVSPLATNEDGIVVIHLDSSEYINITSNHRLAIKVKDNGNLPFATLKKEPVEPQLVYSNASGPFVHNKQYFFSDLKIPYSFAVDFCPDTECSRHNRKRYTTTTEAAPTSPSTKTYLTSDICAKVSLQRSHGRTWLETKRHLAIGTAHYIRARWCENRPITLQLWLLVEQNIYTLVWHKTINENASNAHKLTALAPSEYVVITSYHRLGIHVEGDVSIPIARLQNSAQLVFSNDAGSFARNSLHEFSDLTVPYQFDIDFCHENDCPELNVVSTTHRIKSTTSVFTQSNPVTEQTTKTPHIKSEDCSIRQSYGRAWLETDRSLSRGVARAIIARVCLQKAALLQLWLPADSELYTLIWQKKIPPLPAGKSNATVIRLKPSEYVNITSGHRLAIQVKDTHNLPISIQEVDSMKPQLIYSDTIGPFAVNRHYYFSDLKIPYKFALDFCTDSECEDFDRKSYATTNRPTTPTTTIVTTSATAAGICGEQSLQRSYGRAWLETQRHLTVNTARYIRAKWCENAGVTVQLWIRVDKYSYKLDWQKNISLPALGERTVLPLTPSEYVTITPDHRLSIQMQRDGNIPVARLAHGPQLVFSNGLGPFARDSVHEFGDLPFPYQFDFDFCHEKDCRNINAIAQAHTTTKAQLVTEREEKSPSEELCDQMKMHFNMGRVMLEKSRVLPRGMLKAISTLFCDETAVNIQLWEPIADDKRFRLVWQKEVIPSQRRGGQMIVNLSEDDQIDILPYYRLAMQSTNDSDHISIPSRFSSANIVNSIHSTTMQHCAEEMFDDLQYPWSFHLRLCLQTDCMDEVEDNWETDNGNQGQPTITNVSICDLQADIPDKSVTANVTTATEAHTKQHSSKCPPLGADAKNKSSMSSPTTPWLVAITSVIFMFCKT